MTAPELATWPALVLAAGLATRLRPLSDIRAKAALPIAGQPLVGRILNWLHAAGIRHVVLNLHHRPDTVTRIVGDGAEWDMRVRYSWEPVVLGSAGGPRHALTLLDAERFLIVNGDTLTDCDVRTLVHQHLVTGARVTMAVVRRQVDRGVTADSSGIVTGFGPGHDHFIGVQAVDADVFAALADHAPAESVNSVYPRLLREQPGSLRVYRSSAEFLEAGTPSDYLHTVDVIARREGRELDRGTGATVHPSARVIHTVLWDRVVVRADARLSDCIVADDVVVPTGATYDRCVLVNTSSGLAATRF